MTRRFPSRHGADVARSQIFTVGQRFEAINFFIQYVDLEL